MQSHKTTHVHRKKNDFSTTLAQRVLSDTTSSAFQHQSKHTTDTLPLIVISPVTDAHSVYFK